MEEVEEDKKTKTTTTTTAKEEENGSGDAPANGTVSGGGRRAHTCRVKAVLMAFCLSATSVQVSLVSASIQHGALLLLSQAPRFVWVVRRHR